MTDDLEPFGTKGGRSPPLTRASSQLVSDFFDYMNSHNFHWVVMNNYEGLPWDIPSDIDFSIPAKLFHQLDSFVGKFASNASARILQKIWHGNMKCAYILAVGPQTGREFVQLDFFTNFSTKGCPELLSHEEMVEGRRALRNFFVPRPEVELLFTVMRRVFKNDWSERHCDRIALLRSRIPDPDWLASDYEWIRNTIEAAIRGEVEIASKRRAGDWKKLRALSSRNMPLAKKMANTAVQIRRIATRLRDETGQVVVLAAPLESINKQAFERLEMVFHRRLVLVKGSPSTLIWRVAMLKRRKGLVLVVVKRDEPGGKSLAKCFARLGLADQLLYQTDGVGEEQLELELPATSYSSSTEAIEAIINVQAKKTASAIARGGTQTSGINS